VKSEVCEEYILGANVVVDATGDSITELVILDTDAVKKDDESIGKDVYAGAVIEPEDDTTCSDCVKDIDVKLLAICNDVPRVD